MNLLSHVENNLQQHLSTFDQKFSSSWASMLPILQERMGDAQWKHKILNEDDREKRFVSLDKAFEWSAPIPNNIQEEENFFSTDFNENVKCNSEQKNGTRIDSANCSRLDGVLGNQNCRQVNNLTTPNKKNNSVTVANRAQPSFQSNGTFSIDLSNDSPDTSYRANQKKHAFLDNLDKKYSPIQENAKTTTGKSHGNLYSEKNDSTSNSYPQSLNACNVSSQMTYKDENKKYESRINTVTTVRKDSSYAKIDSTFPHFATSEPCKADGAQNAVSSHFTAPIAEKGANCFNVNSNAVLQQFEMSADEDIMELLSIYSVEKVELIIQMWKSKDPDSRTILDKRIRESDLILDAIIREGEKRFLKQCIQAESHFHHTGTSSTGRNFSSAVDLVNDYKDDLYPSLSRGIKDDPFPPLPRDIEVAKLEAPNSVVSAPAMTNFKEIPPIDGYKIEQYDPISVLNSRWHRGSFSWLQEINSLNQQIFGHHQWRPNQLEIINCIMSNRDVLATMPTGGGKSLCYQIPALALHGITIVVQPLLSLIEDQVGILESLDVPVNFLGTSQTAEQSHFIYEQLSNPHSCRLKILFVTPEKLAQDKMRSLLKQVYEARFLSLFVIDECHCVSQWGHEFRKEYKSLSCLKDLFPRIPILALTATATCCVKTDILSILQIYKNVVCFTSSFDRSNLYFGLRIKKKTCFDEIEQFINERKNQSGIIYCLSKKDCENIAKEFQNRGFLCDRYHSGLSTAEKTKIQSKWTQGLLQFICATIAFGMGINKADVRWILHHSIPKSLEGFYQEAGRAGRDGELAACILFYNYADFWRLLKLVSKEQVDGKWVKKNRFSVVEGHSRIQEMMSYAMNDVDCRHRMLLEHFGETYSDPNVKCKNCDNCLDDRPTQDCDVTSICEEMIEVVRNYDGIKRTEFFNLLKGKKLQKQDLSDSPHFGKYKKDKKTLIERVYIYLLKINILKEKFHLTSHCTYSTLSLGSLAERERLKRSYPLIFKIRQEQAKKFELEKCKAISGVSRAKRGKTTRNPPSHSKTSVLDTVNEIIVIEDENENPKKNSAFPSERISNHSVDAPAPVELTKKFKFVPDHEIDELEDWIDDDDEMDAFSKNSPIRYPLQSGVDKKTNFAAASFDPVAFRDPAEEDDLRNAVPSTNRALSSRNPHWSDGGSLHNNYKYASFLNRKDPYFDLRHQLIENLIDLRQEISQEESTGKRVVENLFSIQLIARMAHELPISESEVAKVNGIGAKRSEKYGTRFAFRIQSFLQKNKELEKWKNPNDIYSSINDGEIATNPQKMTSSNKLQPAYYSLATADNIADEYEESDEHDHDHENTPTFNNHQYDHENYQPSYDFNNSNAKNIAPFTPLNNTPSYHTSPHNHTTLSRNNPSTSYYSSFGTISNSSSLPSSSHLMD